MAEMLNSPHVQRPQSTLAEDPVFAENSTESPEDASPSLLPASDGCEKGEWHGRQDDSLLSPQGHDGPHVKSVAMENGAGDEQGDVATQATKKPHLSRSVSFRESDPAPRNREKAEKSTPKKKPRTRFIKVNYDEVNGICIFKDAAIYLLEGENNDSFSSHPQGWWSYMAFHIVHNEVYQYIQLAVSLLLMGLAIIEPPSYVTKAISPRIHAVLEMGFLLFFAVDAIILLLWLCPKTFFTTKRPIIKVLFLVVLFTDAMVVVCRGEVHMRFLRCLRPFYFIDCYLTSGVRRVLTQIVNSFSPILDVLLLYFLTISLFSFIAFYLYGAANNIYFLNFRETFVSMFICQTTSNFPDLMMQSYNEFRITPLFFMLYMIIQYILLSNILLAVMYSIFQWQSMEKFKKFYLHKKEALQRVFKKVSERRHTNAIHFADFYPLMKAYRPSMSKVRVLCIFKALDKEETDEISLKEFYKFYDVLSLKWERVDHREEESFVWHKRLPWQLSKVFQWMRKVVMWQFFDLIINLIIVGNGIILWAYAAAIDLTDSQTMWDYNGTNGNSWISSVSIFFTVLYSIELTVKILALGPQSFFTKAWNVFDAGVVVIAIIGHLSEQVLAEMIIFLRPLRLLRLLRLKRRYRDVMNTLVVLLPQLLSIGLLLCIIFYSYAIIGMEVFHDTVHENCCQSTNESYSVEEAYATGAFYWLNNFDNIFNSYVILFELLLGNNWHILMDGFTNATGNFAARAYFIIFILISEVLLTIIISYIVDTFVSQYLQSEKLRETLKKNQTENQPEEGFLAFCTKQTQSVMDSVQDKVEEVDIPQKHIEALERINAITITDRLTYNLHKQSKNAAEGRQKTLTFRGRSRRNKEDVKEVLYQEEIERWNKDFEEQSSATPPPSPAKSVRAEVLQRIKAQIEYWIL